MATRWYCGVSLIDHCHGLWVVEAWILFQSLDQLIGGPGVVCLSLVP